VTRRRKVWFGGSLVLLLAALVAVVVALRGRRKAVEVEVEAIAERPLVQLVTASGEIQPVLSVDVNANVNGMVERLAVAEGDTVHQGDFLLQIDPVSVEAAAEAQEAMVRSSESEAVALRAQLDQARRVLERARQLAGRELISREELQQDESEVARLEAEIAAAEARVVQARATLRSSRHEVELVTMTAPISGVITRLDVEKGEFAFTGLNPTLLLTIADLSTMQAEIEVDETDVVNVTVGQPAKVTVDAFPDTSFAGRVTEVGTSPIVRQTAGQTSSDEKEVKDFKVVVRLEQSLPSARAGLSATADIETARRQRAVAVPIQSLVVRELPRPHIQETAPDTLGPAEETEGVFVVKERRARFVPVRTGITGDRFFEVGSGLAPGDTVVTGTYEALRDLEDGDAVKVAKPDERRRERQREERREG
jgi:HlyD family secretion protein